MWTIGSALCTQFYCYERNENSLAKSHPPSLYDRKVKKKRFVRSWLGEVKERNFCLFLWAQVVRPPADSFLFLFFLSYLTKQRLDDWNQQTDDKKTRRWMRILAWQRKGRERLALLLIKTWPLSCRAVSFLLGRGDAGWNQREESSQSKFKNKIEQWNIKEKEEFQNSALSFL